MDISPKQTKTLILIVDKENVFGSSLGHELKKQGTVVLVTAEAGISEDELVTVPFHRGVPQIPDGWYTHVVLVWGSEAEALLEPLAQKAADQQAKLFVIASPKDVTDVVSRLSGLPVAAQEMYVGDLFGEGCASPLNTYLEKAKGVGKISLPNMGLHTWKPVLFHDAVAKMADLILVSRRMAEPHFIGPSHAITALSLFHGVQKADPDLRIDFSSEHDESREEEPRAVSAFAVYDAVAKVREYYQSLVVKRAVKHVSQEKVVVLTHSTKPKTRPKRLWYAGYVFLVIVLLPLLSAVFAGGVGALLLFLGVRSVVHGDFSQAKLETEISQQCFSFSQNALGVVRVEAGLVGGGKAVGLMEQRAKLASQVSLLATSGVSLTQSVSEVFLGKTIAPESNVTNTVASLKQFAYTLSQIDRQTVPTQYLSAFDALQRLGGISASVADELPQVIGANGDRSYLVLFQNNMELRPGGGFIGSYGVLTLHLGAVKSFAIHNVYDADGQLKGHVEPPFPIRRYIPIVHLFLRDSNFDPDFSVDAQQAAFMLSQETGQRVDGVIGVDLDVLKTMLGIVGSVYVPAYNQTVTTQNFFTLIEQHAEKNSFPGSTQKQQFLNAFFSALMEKAKGGKFVGIAHVPQAIDSLLAGKHLLVAFPDPLLQLPFSLAHVSGSLVDTRPAGNGILNDFLGVVEANLGVNKVNAFVTRSLTQDVVVDASGNVNELATLTLHNTSDGTWPGGAYRDYVRFIVPQQAVLQGIALNGVDQHVVAAVTDPKTYEAKGFVPPVGLEVDRTEEAGKSLFGFFVSVPEKEDVIIAVRYQLPHAIVSSETAYNMLLWKQGGVEEYPYQLRLTVPQADQVLRGSMAIAHDRQSASFQTTMQGDTAASATFAARGN